MNANDTINKVFNAYDNYIKNMPLHYQILISLGLLIFLLWNIYAFLKSGNWILIVILLAALPGTWPAARALFNIVWMLVKGLAYRISQ